MKGFLNFMNPVILLVGFFAAAVYADETRTLFAWMVFFTYPLTTMFVYEIGELFYNKMKKD